MVRKNWIKKRPLDFAWLDETLLLKVDLQVLCYHNSQKNEILIFIVASNVCFYYPSSKSGLKEKGQKSGTHVWEQVRIVFLVASDL